MTVIDFLLLTLAASALVDVWRNGSLFAELRAYLEMRADRLPVDPGEVTEGVIQLPSEPTPVEVSPLWMRLCDRLVPAWLAELLSCSFCFSHHTPWIVIVVLYLPVLCWDSPWLYLCKVPLWSLAATRLGNIINACLPQAARYERTHEDSSYRGEHD